MHLRRGPSWRVATAALLCIVIEACGAPGPSAPNTGRTAAATILGTSAPPTTAASTSIPSPQPDAAPVQLQGRWNTVISPGDDATLKIFETVYQITRGGASGSGHLSVDGATITFYDSTNCDGDGVYTWAIDATGKLGFTPTGPDPCPRVDVLIGTTFVRAGS